MTRLFKVSLSVVALLLVALMVLTGCGKANEALATAEEAKKAVVDATADLEAALADKADSKELADKVAALNAAIQAAQTVASDGDVALNKAIDDARKAIETNVDTLLAAYKVDVNGLLSGKADKETVNAQVKELMDMVANIESATLASINLKDYVSWNTVIAAYLFELDEIHEGVKAYATLYSDENWAEIVKAYKVAEVSLYRSFGTDENTAMADAAFQVYRDALAKYPNAVDVVYYGEGGVIEYLALETKTTEAAKAVYEKVLNVLLNATNDNAKKLVRKYYVINEDNELTEIDLIDLTLGNYKAEVLKETTAFGKIFPVHSTHGTYGSDGDTYTAINGKVTAFQSAYTTLTEASHTTEITNIAAADIVAFAKNGAILAVLNNAETGAVKRAEAVAALAYTTDVALTPTCVNAINAWNKACQTWENDFLTKNKPAVLEGENVARYNAVAELIADTKKALGTKLEELDVAAKPYNDDAKPFMELVAKYYDADKKVDATKVGLLSGAELTKAFDLALAWADKYEHLDLALIYAAGEKKPGEVVAETVELKRIYSEKAEAAVPAWDALDHDAIAEYIADDTKLTIYDTKVYAAYAWFTTYGLELEGVYQEGCDEPNLIDATAEYFGQIKDLKAKLDKLIADKKAAAEALNTALDGLANITLSQEAKIAAAKELYTAYLAADNAATKYDNTKTELNTDREFTIADYDANVDNVARIKNAAEKITAIKADQKAMNDKAALFTGDTGFNSKLNETFAETKSFFNTNITKDDYISNLNDLKDLIDAFIAENQNQAETYTTDAQKVLDDGRTLVALDNVLTAEEAVKAYNKDLNVIPSFFNTVNFTDYQTAVATLRTNLTAYDATASAVAADVAAAKATLAAADLVIAKENLYNNAFVAEVYTPIATEATADLDGDAETKALNELKVILDEFALKIVGYTAEEIAAYNSTAGNEKISADLTGLELLLKNQAVKNGVVFD